MAIVWEIANQKIGTEGRVNAVREKMVELIKQIVIPFWAGEIADHLISNDVVPVVRCKDCALQGKFNCPMDEWVKTDGNGFCHHGKRKDDDG